MELKSNRGITGIDITVAIVIIVLFVGIIASLVYNFGQSSKAVNRKADATNFAISKIEQVKQATYASLTEGTTTEYKNANGVTVASASNAAYTITTTVEMYKNTDYASNVFTSSELANLKDVIKIVTVRVSYTVGNNETYVELSTPITDEGE